MSRQHKIQYLKRVQEDIASRIVNYVSYYFDKGNRMGHSDEKICKNVDSWSEIYKNNSYQLTEEEEIALTNHLQENK